MSAIDIAARLAGVPQDTIDKVEAAAPKTAALLTLLKENEDLIVQDGAFAKKAMPLAQEAYAEFVAIMPAAEAVVAFIASQKKPDASVSDQQPADPTMGKFSI